MLRALPSQTNTAQLVFITARTCCCHACVELLLFVKASIHCSRDLNLCHPPAMGFPYLPGSDKTARKLPSSLVLTASSMWDLRNFSQVRLVCSHGKCQFQLNQHFMMGKEKKSESIPVCSRQFYYYLPQKRPSWQTFISLPR